MTDATVEELLIRVSRQDAVAFRALYDRLSPKLLGIALRILKRREAAEDVVQDVFVKLWTGSAVFDPAFGSGTGFLATIARNRALDFLRRKSEQPSVDEAEFDSLVDLSPSPETTAADRSDLKALLACLDQLADGPRRAILAAYLDGASGEDIATRLKTPVGTIKSWIHRGLAAVRECLGR